MVFWCFQGVKNGNIGKKQVKLFFFSPVFLFYTPVNFRKFSIVSRGYNHWEKNRWNDKLFMLTFTKFKNRFFQGATLSNWFQIFKWIARESLLHRVLGVHKHAGIGIQINTLQTQGNQMTLIHCCFNVTTLKQRWTNVIFYPLRLQGNF